MYCPTSSHVFCLGLPPIQLTRPTNLQTPHPLGLHSPEDQNA